MRLQPSLYRAISEFQIDEPGSSLTFTDRLARDNGWSADYARRVVEEYKRFAFLSVRPTRPAVGRNWGLMK